MLNNMPNKMINALISRAKTLKRPLAVALVAVLLLGIFGITAPANATVSKLTLYRRSCAAIYAQVTWDSFTQGEAPYKVGFAADLNGNGIYGEEGEPNVTVQVRTGGNQGIRVGSRMTFDAVPEGTVISVTAYDMDNNGVRRSGFLPSVTYACTQRPALEDLREPDAIEPIVAVQLQVFRGSTQVYTDPNPTADVLGGLGNGQRVEVVALNERGDWAKIKFEGGYGWVLWRTNAIINGTFDDLPRE